MKKMVSTVFIVVMLVISSFNQSVSYAALEKKPTTKQMETLVSNEDYRGEYFKVRTPKDEKCVVYVSGKVKTNVKRLCIRIKKHGTGIVYITAFVKPNKKGEFSIKINTKQGNKNVPKVLNEKGTITKAKGSVSTCPGYSKVKKMTVGTYHLNITAATTKKDADVSKGIKWKSGTLGGNQGYIYKEALLTVKNGQENNLKLIKYDDIITNNLEIRNLYEKKNFNIDNYLGSYIRYQDPSMKDISFVFKDPKTQQYEYMTTKQVNYIAKVADKITEGCGTDYQKALKIYEYVAKNVYYDSYALAMHKNQYSNPYKNLYNLRNKKKSANSVDGKVATTCQGYASLVVALARAEGIPARFVYGRHIHQPGTIWANVRESDLNTVTHYWSELYLNGKWTVVDARSATKNRWARTSFSSKGNWIKKKYINYSHFDPTDEQLSASYIYIGVYPGSKDSKYMNRIDEIEQLSAFLNTESEYMTLNGKLLNSDFDVNDYSSWGTGEDNNLKTNGHGRISRIAWPAKGLSGTFELEGFKALKNVVLYENNFSKVRITDCPKLKVLNLRDNPLTEVEFEHNGKDVFMKCTTGGTFSIRYNQNYEKDLTVFATPEEGYICVGVYDSITGEHVSASSISSFNPKETSYIVMFIESDYGYDFDDNEESEDIYDDSYDDNYGEDFDEDYIEPDERE